MLNIGSIRIYILMTGVVSNETNEDVRMYIIYFQFGNVREYLRDYLREYLRE